MSVRCLKHTSQPSQGVYLASKVIQSTNARNSLIFHQAIVGT